MLIEEKSTARFSVRLTLLLKSVCLSFLFSFFMITPVNAAKVYHCLQDNGTKGYQGRPCEEGKKTVAVTEQKIAPTKEEPIESLSIIGKWQLNGISSNLDGEIQTQKEKISWAFFDNGTVTYQYDDTNAVYDYTFEEKTINIPDSQNSSFEIIKSESNSAIWKTGETYYFLTLVPIT